jgi:diacylglycerol O-acyltransferase
MSETATPMTPVDTAWLRMDTDVNLMMIVGVWLLTPAIRHGDLCERIRTRLLRFERFRQKAVPGALGARWVSDDAFDLARHVVVEKLHRRRGQSARSALQERMGELAATPLDPAHPLWQFHLVERHDGGSALVCRIHHCIGDGVALNSVMMSITDDGIQPPAVDAHDADAPEAHVGDWLSEKLLRPLTAATVHAIELYGEALVKALHAAEHPRRSVREAAEAARSGVQLVDAAAALAFLRDDARTGLKGHGSGRKVVSWCEPLPLDRVKAVGKALGASVNDVLIACVAGAIGHYLREVGEDPDGKDIRALVPVTCGRSNRRGSSAIASASCRCSCRSASTSPSSGWQSCARACRRSRAATSRCCRTNCSRCRACCRSRASRRSRAGSSTRRPPS